MCHLSMQNFKPFTCYNLEAHFFVVVRRKVTPREDEILSVNLFIFC